MWVVGYASRVAVMCGEPMVGSLLCDKERLCGIGWVRLCDKDRVMRGLACCVSRCGVMVALCGGYGTMVGGMRLCGRYGYAVRIRLCGGQQA